MGRREILLYQRTSSNCDEARRAPGSFSSCSFSLSIHRQKSFTSFVYLCSAGVWRVSPSIYVTQISPYLCHCVLECPEVKPGVKREGGRQGCDNSGSGAVVHNRTMSHHHGPASQPATLVPLQVNSSSTSNLFPVNPSSSYTYTFLSAHVSPSPSTHPLSLATFTLNASPTSTTTLQSSSTPIPSNKQYDYPSPPSSSYSEIHECPSHENKCVIIIVP